MEHVALIYLHLDHEMIIQQLVSKQEDLPPVCPQEILGASVSHSTNLLYSDSELAHTP